MRKNRLAQYCCCPFWLRKVEVCALSCPCFRVLSRSAPRCLLCLCRFVRRAWLAARPENAPRRECRREGSSPVRQWGPREERVTEWRSYEGAFSPSLCVRYRAHKGMVGSASLPLLRCIQYGLAEQDSRCHVQDLSLAASVCVARVAGDGAVWLFMCR